MAKEVTILPMVYSFIYLLLQTHSLLPTHLPTPQPQSRSDDLTEEALQHAGRASGSFPGSATYLPAVLCRSVTVCWTQFPPLNNGDSNNTQAPVRSE